MGTFREGAAGLGARIGVMTKSITEEQRARISTVRCDSCNGEVTPDFDAHNLGHSCSSGSDLLGQIEYELEMNTVLCEKCDESHLPTLGEIHSC